MKLNKKGFSTLEIVITIAIFGILVPVFSLGINNINVVNGRARDLALTNMLAQNKVELLRSAGFNSIDVGTTTFTDELPNILGSPKSAEYVVTNPENGIKEVVVSISYTEYGNSRTVEYKTIISELGVAQ